MTVKSAQAIADRFITLTSAGALADADALPTAVLTVNGVDNGAAVTVTDVGVGLYKWACTLPALSAGDIVAVVVAATIGGVATGGVVWQETGDTKLVSNLNDIAAGVLMGLVDEAITSAKYDESSAFPLKSADTGATQVARVGADGDTLETLSDEVDTAQADLDNPNQYKADVSALALQASVDDLEGRLTATRAGYLDNLGGGAVAHAGDAMTLTAGERSSVATAVWAATVRTLSSFGTLVADIWNALTSGMTTVGSIGKRLADYIDVAISSRMSSGGSVTYTGPVAISDDATIVRGMDYYSADGRALEWSTTLEATWPTLTGATINFYSSLLDKAGTVVTGTGATKKVRVELSAAETLAATLGTAAFKVVATLSNGHKVDLVSATIAIEERET